MMDEFLPLSLTLGAGVGLGLFYFGGLWLTVQGLITAQRPIRLMVVSFIGRTGITLLGFYFIAGSRWDRWGACLLGFLAVRSILIQCWGSKISKS